MLRRSAAPGRRQRGRRLPPLAFERSSLPSRAELCQRRQSGLLRRGRSADSRLAAEAHHAQLRGAADSTGADGRAQESAALRGELPRRGAADPGGEPGCAKGRERVAVRLRAVRGGHQDDDACAADCVPAVSVRDAHK